MTESEAKNIIFARAECEAREHKCDKDKCDECELLYMQGTVSENKEALNMAIQALEEVQAYRAIGTVEELKSMKENGSFSGVELAQIAIQLNELKEYKKIGTIERFRELTEKAEPKKPTEVDERIAKDYAEYYYLAFMCPSCCSPVIGQPYRPKHCKHCGQRLDWE